MEIVCLKGHCTIDKKIDNTFNNIELLYTKEEFIADFFLFIENFKYSLVENFDFGFKDVLELNLIIQEKNFEEIKIFIRGHEATKSIYSNKTDTEGCTMVEFVDGTKISFDFIWSYNCDIKNLFDINEAFTTVSNIDNYKSFNNYNIARCIGLNYYQKKERIPNRLKKYGIVLVNSLDSLDKILYNLYFNEKI